MADEPNAPEGLAATYDPSKVISTDGPKMGLVATTTGDLGAGLDPETPYATVGDKTFANQEELSTWYDQTQKERLDAEGLGDEAPKDPTDGKAPKEEPKDGEPVARTDDEIRASLKEAGGIYADPNYEAAALEFEKNNGVVSPETIKATAEGFGVSEDYVKAFIDAQKTARDAQAALATQRTDQLSAAEMAVQADLHEVVGGAKAYGDFSEWAKENLTPAQQKAYDKALDDTDPTTAKVLLEAYAAKWKASGDGPRPRDITHEGVPSGKSGGAEGYASSEEMQKDMRDPRYQTDEKFRQQVAQRVGASTF